MGSGQGPADVVSLCWTPTSIRLDRELTNLEEGGQLQDTFPLTPIMYKILQ